MIGVYALGGLIGFAILAAVTQQKPSGSYSSKTTGESQGQSTQGLPGGRSAGAVSAIYSGIDNQMMHDLRAGGNAKSQAADKAN